MPTRAPKIHGLIAAPFTPFRPDGKLAVERIEQQVEFLSLRGVAGAFIGGTTGEGVSLTQEERLALTSAWKSAAPRSMKLIVHVGASSIKDSEALARQAESIGADGIALAPMSCITPDSLPTLVNYCAEIAAAAPRLPFYYYHIPSLTRVNFKVHDLLEMAQARIPNLAGCKFTYEDLMDYSRAADMNGARFDCLFGRDEMLLPSLVLGAEGWVGSTYNFAAPLYLKIIAAYRLGNVVAARRYQLQACEMIQTLVDFGGLPAMKALCGELGLDLGPVRLPMKQPEPAKIREMVAKLSRQGFMQYFAPLEQPEVHDAAKNGQSALVAAA